MGETASPGPATGDTQTPVDQSSGAPGQGVTAGDRVRLPEQSGRGFRFEEAGHERAGHADHHAPPGRAVALGEGLDGIEPIGNVDLVSAVTSRNPEAEHARCLERIGEIGREPTGGLDFLGSLTSGDGNFTQNGRTHTVDSLMCE